MHSVFTRKTVESTLEQIRKRTAAYDELTSQFGPLFLLKTELIERLSDSMPPLAFDPKKYSAGVPLLVDKDLSPWADAFLESTKRVIPQAAKILSMPEEDRARLLQYLTDKTNILGLAQARLEGNWNHFDAISEEQGIHPPGALFYIAENILSPVFSTMTATLGESLTEETWDQGTCPVCGSLPTISQLSPREVSSLDQLVGGGGKKYLHCSLCNTDWRFKRNACPACGNDDQDTREVLYADDARHERIEACHQCGAYCLNVDMRECDPLPNLDVLQLGLIHLDMHARKKELAPMTRTLWNSLDP